MKRPLRYRTMGAVREGRGNPSPYSILHFNLFGLAKQATSRTHLNKAPDC